MTKLIVLITAFLSFGLAVACSTRYEVVPTLAICSGLFLLGLMSDYFFRPMVEAGSWWGRWLYTVVPNWQVFWLADALENQKSIPWSYVGKVFGYLTGYLGAVLAVALWLFEDRELN